MKYIGTSVIGINEISHKPQNTCTHSQIPQGSDFSAASKVNCSSRCHQDCAKGLQGALPKWEHLVIHAKRYIPVCPAPSGKHGSTEALPQRQLWLCTAEPGAATAVPNPLEQPPQCSLWGELPGSFPTAGRAWDWCQEFTSGAMALHAEPCFLGRGWTSLAAEEGSDRSLVGTWC